MHHVSDGTINQSISATRVRAAQADAPSLEAKPLKPRVECDMPHQLDAPRFPARAKPRARSRPIA
jgi:hypothetical protein